MHGIQRTLLVLAALGLTSCGSRPASSPPASSVRAHILTDVPRYPSAALRDTTVAENAESLTYLTIASFDAVVAFYRRELPAAGWVLTAELGDSLIMDLQAQRGGATVWVHIEPKPQVGTEFTIVGSGPASSPPAPATSR